MVDKRLSKNIESLIGLKKTGLIDDEEYDFALNLLESRKAEAWKVCIYVICLIFS